MSPQTLTEFWVPPVGGVCLCACVCGAGGDELRLIHTKVLLAYHAMPLKAGEGEGSH